MRRWLGVWIVVAVLIGVGYGVRTSGGSPSSTAGEESRPVNEGAPPPASAGFATILEGISADSVDKDTALKAFAAVPFRSMSASR